ncbi:MAG: hypothetical protein NC489_30570 [Ruminococcus flavefaciens]|nr:hypothetical protein [Ruminococcus flavefaciens]
MFKIIKTTIIFFSFKYTQNKILYSLSALLVLSIFIIIRFCQYPLLIHTQLFEKLFVSASNDNTLYNIAISYIAAYIFYIFQVYVPSMLNHYKSYKLLFPSISKEIELLKKMHFICKNSLTISNNIHINPTISSFYFIAISDDKTYLHKFTYKESYNHYKEKLIELHNQITSNPNLSLLDYGFLYKYLSININEFFIFMDNVDRNMESNINVKIDSIRVIDDFEKAISDFVDSYGFISLTDFSLEVSEDDKMKYNYAHKRSKLPEYMYALMLTPPMSSQ